MINSIIALIVTLIIPVIVYWINPYIFGEHQLDVYEYQGDAYDVDAGIGSECQAAPGSGLIRLDSPSLNLSNKIKDISGGACISNEIKDKLKALDGKLRFEIQITQGYNGPSSHYDPCHKAGRALDIVINPRYDIPKWNELIGIIMSVDPNAYIIVEARCDYLCEDNRATCHNLSEPDGVCKEKCTETRYREQITWCQTNYTQGSKATGARHLHVCFSR